MADEPRNYVANRDGMVQGALKSLDAQATTGAGTAFNLGACYSAFGIEYLRASATTASTKSTAAVIQLQGKIGSTKWRNLGATITVNSTAGAIARSTNSIPVNQVRINIDSFTTGVKPGVSAWVAVGIGSS